MAARAELRPRRAELSAGLMAGRKDAIDRLVSQMLYGFVPPSGSVSPVRIAATASDLYQFPEWAVKAGLSKAARAVKDPSFPPSSVECSAAVRSLLDPFIVELRDIDRLLSAEIAPPANPERAREVMGVIQGSARPSADSNARVRAMVDQFKAGIAEDQLAQNAASAPRWRAPMEEEAKATLANPPAHWTAPVTISEALAEKLGIDAAEKRPLTADETDAFARETL